MTDKRSLDELAGAVRLSREGTHLDGIPSYVKYAPRDDATPDWVLEIMKYDIDQIGLGDFYDLYGYYEERSAITEGAVHTEFDLRYWQFLTLYTTFDEMLEALEDAMS